MVSRDNNGEILAARAGTRVGTSPLKGEALALRLGVLLAEDHCWETAIFQSDAQVLIDQLSHSEVLPDWIIEEDVLYLKSRWQEHPNWQFCWIPSEANGLAHEVAHWCRRMDVVSDE
ncbi:hypothetical protein CJ030_MR0G022773 [Morella rubra]|uniref:RNase H type-1 domain-containing protein n=1 Tax=Morella rubra TaxID=262757 RepID=A0A6A1UK20_9ROSI|nr:hypothetical protein CJ030_MR0G022773 [Morella rubra]